MWSGLKEKIQDILFELADWVLMIVFFGLFIGIVASLIYLSPVLRTTVIYKIIILLAYPYLVLIAYLGYPLGYYHLTGRRFLKRSVSFSEQREAHYERTILSEESPEERRLLRR